MWKTFEGMVVQRTARGVLFQGVYWDAPLWFPASQTEVTPDGAMGCVFRVKSWLTKKLGAEEFTYYSEEEIKRMAGIS